MFNCTGIQQIRESAQVSIDSALGRAQSALNEGVATRLNALRLKTELEDLQVEVEELRAVEKQRNPALTYGRE
jgi:hypothetical protein